MGSRRRTVIHKVFFDTWNVIMLETGRYLLTDRYALQVACPQAFKPQSGNPKCVPGVPRSALSTPKFDTLAAVRFLTDLHRFTSIERFDLCYGKTLRVAMAGADPMEMRYGNGIV